MILILFQLKLSSDDGSCSFNTWGINSKDKMILRTVIKKMKIGRKTININDKNKPRLQGRAN